MVATGQQPPTWGLAAEGASGAARPGFRDMAPKAWLWYQYLAGRAGCELVFQASCLSGNLHWKAFLFLRHSLCRSMCSAYSSEEDLTLRVLFLVISTDT